MCCPFGAPTACADRCSDQVVPRELSRVMFQRSKDTSAGGAREGVDADGCVIPRTTGYSGSCRASLPPAGELINSNVLDTGVCALTWELCQ